MKKEDSIRAEFRAANGKIDNLLQKYKYDTDDWKYIGMINEADALAIVIGTSKILRRTLETITKDYSIGKNTRNEIVAQINLIKNKISGEVNSENVIPSYGAYTDGYGMAQEKTYEESLADFKNKIDEATMSMEMQIVRIDNFRKRKTREALIILVPIVISIFALIVSVINLFIVQPVIVDCDCAIKQQENQNA